MKNKHGFTLVELLIVIALIGVLAVALVATLNPIEQVNKATDARYKNDSAELLAAIERYYASNLKYPWVNTGSSICGTGGSSTCDSNDDFIGQEAQVVGIGVCGDANCSSGGELITTKELKDSFRRKEQFVSGVDDADKLHLVKEDLSSAVYVCFIPKSDTNRRNAPLADIYEGGIYQGPADCSGEPSSWDDVTTACLMCAPEVGTAIGAGGT